MNHQEHADGIAERPIRLAYVSADFRDHPVGHLLVGVVEEHDRSRFDLVGVSVGHDDEGEISRRFQRSFDYFLTMRGQSRAAIANAMRKLHVDIAVDLGGYTAESRYDVFALRPAPVQINWLGYPGTMGSAAYDYIVADRHVIPPELERYYSERVIRLPYSYMPTDSKLQVAAGTPSRSACGLPETGLVYCSFNQMMKITREVFVVWMRLLRAVDGSVLWLRGDNELAQENLRREAVAAGVESDRLVFAPRMDLVADHLARYRVADLFLDTFPYNAHTTAADALYVGLPVVTVRAESFASRVGSSLLATLGMDELVTESLEDYYRVALALSRDSGRLARLRAALEDRRSSSPLFNTKQFARDLESAFEAVHRRRLAGELPVSIDFESSANTA